MEGWGLKQFDAEIRCYKCQDCGLSFIGENNLENNTSDMHQNTVNPTSPAQSLPGLGDYLSSLEKKMDFCTDLVMKQAAMLEKLLANHKEKSSESSTTMKASNEHIEIIEIEEDLTVRRGFQSKIELDKHTKDVYTQKDSHIPATQRSETLFNCDKCKNVFTSSVNLNRHVNQDHVSKAKVKNTLLLGDSNSKYQNPRLIEKVLGGKGLFTRGCVRPRTGRAYCSSRDWPNSHFPDNNLEEKVLEQLAMREHSHLIFGAPCNDISNIGDIQDTYEKQRLAVKSSENCIKIAEKALR